MKTGGSDPGPNSTAAAPHRAYPLCPRPPHSLNGPSAASANPPTAAAALPVPRHSGRPSVGQPAQPAQAKRAYSPGAAKGPGSASGGSTREQTPHREDAAASEKEPAAHLAHAARDVAASWEEAVPGWHLEHLPSAVALCAVGASARSAPAGRVLPGPASRASRRRARALAARVRAGAAAGARGGGAGAGGGGDGAGNAPRAGRGPVGGAVRAALAGLARGRGEGASGGSGQSALRGGVLAAAAEFAGGEGQGGRVPPAREVEYLPKAREVARGDRRAGEELVLRDEEHLRVGEEAVPDRDLHDAVVAAQGGAQRGVQGGVDAELDVPAQAAAVDVEAHGDAVGPHLDERPAVLPAQDHPIGGPVVQGRDAVDGAGQLRSEFGVSQRPLK